MSARAPSAWPLSPNRTTIGATLGAARRRLRAVSASPQREAELLLAAVLTCDRAMLVAHPERKLAAGDATRFERLVTRRAHGEPVAYLVGEAGFYGRTFAVTPDVLIPRPETELVIEAALADLRSRARAGRVRRSPKRVLRVCDVGTGSGAIAITLALEVPDAEVWATDLSAAALALARRNAKHLGASVRFRRGDRLAPLRTRGPFDCIVANLPYVPSDAIPQKPDPVGFEPVLAVDGGPDGLALYRRLLAQLPEVAAPGASGFLEAAPPTLAALAELVAGALPTAHLEIGEDYAQLERYLSLALP